MRPMRKILCVDRSEWKLSLLKMQLRVWRYEPVECFSEGEALCMLDSEPFDLVILGDVADRADARMRLHDFRPGMLVLMLGLPFPTAETQVDWVPADDAIVLKGWLAAAIQRKCYLVKAC